MTYLYPLWLFFSAFFFYMGYISWRQSQQGIRSFNIRKRDQPEPAPETLEEANKVFVEEFNNYLATMNDHNKRRLRASSIGFFIAGVVSMVSMFMALFG